MARIGRPPMDHFGKRFGRLVVIDHYVNNGKLTCRCDCGEVKSIKYSNLSGGNARSCGCLGKEYGHSDRVNDALSKARMANEYEGTSIGKIKSEKPYANNNTGHRGVVYYPDIKRYKATLCFKRKAYYIGLFKTLEEAIKAREKMKDQIYSPFLKEVSNRNAALV